MSAPSPSCQSRVARWSRRAAAAIGSAALDAALDSLELGKRCFAWLAHAHAARNAAVVALVLALAGGAAWAAAFPIWKRSCTQLHAETDRKG